MMATTSDPPLIRAATIAMTAVTTSLVSMAPHGKTVP